jgi:alpha-D-ribose 1-methylphosphonate 5-triphosphate synthase subunit PhnI
VLGPTFDYTHRLMDFALAAGVPLPPAPVAPAREGPTPHVTGFLDREGLIQPEPPRWAEPGDLTRDPLTLPADRALAAAGAGARR